MTPNMMPRKATPVRAVTRTFGSRPVCDWDDRYGPGKPCLCEGVKHAGVESVLRLARTHRNPAMADAIRKAGLR